MLYKGDICACKEMPSISNADPHEVSLSWKWRVVGLYWYVGGNFFQLIDVKYDEIKL